MNLELEIDRFLKIVKLDYNKDNEVYRKLNALCSTYIYQERGWFVPLKGMFDFTSMLNYTCYKDNLSRLKLIQTFWLNVNRLINRFDNYIKRLYKICERSDVSYTSIIMVNRLDGYFREELTKDKSVTEERLDKTSYLTNVVGYVTPIEYEDELAKVNKFIQDNRHGFHVVSVILSSIIEEEDQEFLRLITGI